jgi:hypothetical protein
MIKYLHTLIFFCSLAFLPLQAQLSIQEFMYNNPGEDLYEYVKIQNRSGAALNIADYSMSAGMEATFPDYTLNSGNWFFVVADSVAFASDFADNLSSENIIVQATGALNNGGETIAISDASGQVIDVVTYSDGDGWPTFADGNGSSLTYCGPLMADKSNPELWNLTVFPLGVIVNDQPIYGLLGDVVSQCNSRGSVTFYTNKISVLESAGIASIPIYIYRANQDLVEVEFTTADGTAMVVEDYQLITSAVSSDNDTIDTYMIEVMINDDSVQENDETFTLSFDFFTSTYLSLTASIEVNIIDNDTPLTESLILTGVWDAQPGFSGTKGAEFYALDDIPDLSVFGVGVVNNGNGTDGVEFTFPAESVDAGTFIYLAEDELEFMDYYGFAPNYTFGQINVNGDDAIELFENAQPLDVFGDANLDGTGSAWEYLDGWAYRVSGTSQDFDTFNEGNWTYSGVDALDGPATNAETANPFPIGTYSTMVSTEVILNDDSFTFPVGTTSGNLDVIANDQIPVAINTMAIESPPSNISVVVNPDFSIDFSAPNGYCGTDNFSYVIFYDGGVQEAFVSLSIDCPINYPLLDISSVTVEDAEGVATEIGTSCELIGNVYGVNLSTTGALFTIIDDNGDGIAVFNNDSNLGYEVTEGDVVSIRGTITQFNGLTEIVADEIEKVGESAALLNARSVDFLDESTESNLVELNSVMYVDITQWGGGNSGFNFSVRDNNGFESEIRIDNDVDLFLMPAFGDEFSTLDIRGIGGQFDNSSPFDGGYQLLPRYASDINFTFVSVDDVLGTQLDLFPNPTSKSLTLTSEEPLDEVRISDAVGRLMIQIMNPALQSEIDVQSLNAGMYTVQCIKGDSTFALRLIVQ